MSRLQSSCSPFHFFPPQKHIFFRVSKCGTRRDRGWNIIHFSCLTTTQARNFAGPNGENRPEKKKGQKVAFVYVLKSNNVVVDVVNKIPSSPCTYIV